MSEEQQPIVLEKNWRAILGTDSEREREAVNKEKEAIREKFATHEGNTKANILLLGAIKAGKSSFINSIFSLCKGRIVNMTPAGDAEHSLTKKYAKYTDTDFFKNFNLYDSMGVEAEDGEGFNIGDVVHMIKGHIPNHYQFNPVAPMPADDANFISEPSNDDKIHCVVFVVDAEGLNGDIPMKLTRKILDLQEKINDLGIPRLLLLTKIDKACLAVGADLSTTFKSVKIRDLVDKANALFKIPRLHIHPIKNYESELKTDAKVDALLLIPFQQILNFASDYLKIQEQQ